MKADGVGRKVAVAALLTASALLLLLMIAKCIYIPERTAYDAQAPRVAVPALPAMASNWLLNAGTEEELDQLPEIGPVLARRIIENREQDGRFIFPEDVMEVKGIGPKTLEKILAWLAEHPEAAYVWHEAGE